MMRKVKIEKIRGFKTRNLGTLFKAYFNNKMTILLMMIEHPLIARSVLSVEKQKVFLHDLYHHFLPQNVPMKYHHAFRWLNGFLNWYPEVSPKQIHTAIKMIALIYEALGFRLDKRLEAVRIEKESLKTYDLNAV